MNDDTRATEDPTHENYSCIRIKSNKIAAIYNTINQTPSCYSKFAIDKNLGNDDKPGAYLERILEASMLGPRVQLRRIIGHTRLWIRNSFCLTNTYRI